ncbi:MAG: hypothetical protein H7Z75_09115 [Ferruginibacter sp.]|nr:hypothetical protein [Cytophagales bacterium]
MRGYLIALLLCYQPGAAQDLLRYRNDNFALEVKQVDEFIERFNNDDHTLIKKYLQKLDSGFRFERGQLLKTLFNAADSTWRQPEVGRFIASVSDSTKPVYLDFFDDNWFAELRCTVLYKGKTDSLRLIMKVQRERNNASKWVFVGAAADFLTLPKSKDPAASLNPMSHAVGFSGIDRALSDQKNVRNYLPRGFENHALAIFVQETRNNLLRIQQVNRITYHFLQVDGWLFTLDNYRRNTRNSGWLISRLIPANAAAKLDYKLDVLNLK